MYKIAKKKRTEQFSPAHTLIITNFIWGNNINKEGGGGKDMNYKLNIHHCVRDDTNKSLFSDRTTKRKGGGHIPSITKKITILNKRKILQIKQI